MWLSNLRPIGHPQRIISIVPSQTELLHALGLEQEVIGITRFCELPEHWFRTKTRIGGTKQLHLDKIKALQPDLLLANQEENEKEQVIALAHDFPVWMTNVATLEDALQMIADLGAITGKETKATSLQAHIWNSFSAWERHLLSTHKLPQKVVYLIWQDPLMTIGGDTFIHDLLSRAGFLNLFHEHSRYPVISFEQLVAAQPDLLLLSSEPYPFQKKHFSHFQQALPATRIHLVDGAMFSWYGSRLQHTIEYFHQLHHELSL